MLLVWQVIINDIQSSKPIIIPWWYHNNYSNHFVDLSLHGFSDASNIAFGCYSIEIEEAFKIWIIFVQTAITTDKNFKQLQLDLNAPITHDAKKPIFLPRNTEFTNLVIYHNHYLVMHNGVKETLNQIRTQFWIPKARNYIKKLIKKCPICKRFEGLPYSYPSTPPLPLCRLNNDHAFKFTDLVPDTSAESCIKSLRRFFAKRGRPFETLSGNGLQFTSNLTQNFTSSLGITWHFNIPAAPWWGGFFERLVGSTKRCLRKITHEVESILNNQPITFMYESPGDLPLTPNHLIYGRSTNFKAINDKTYELNLNTRSTYIENTLNHFLQRWEKEYLTELREFHKCKKNKGTNKIAVGDVVLIHDSGTRRGNWKTGIVQSLSKLSDGLIRAAKVRYIMNGKTMYIQRPVNKLYLLEALDAPIETMKINFCDEKDIKHFVIN
nr:uncharacterized protein LOC124814955 [Hydra vulgaris]